MVVAARFPVLTITSSDWRSSAVKLTTAVPASVRYSTIPGILDAQQSQIRSRTPLDWETLYVLFGHISTWMKTGATLPLSLVIILLTEH
jgi:hypothetical protein